MEVFKYVQENVITFQNFEAEVFQEKFMWLEISILAVEMYIVYVQWQ